MNSLNIEEELFADLFAYRFLLIEEYEYEEIDIIQKLKLKLIELNYDRNELNRIIYNFYRYYNIDVNEETIESVRIYIYNFNNALNNELNIMAQYNPAISILMNRLNNIRLIPNEEENVKITVEEEAIEKLPTIIISEENNECSICMEELKINTEGIKLKCNHIYHKNCIKSYLLNYDYKCPLCRADVGHHKIN